MGWMGQLWMFPNRHLDRWKWRWQKDGGGLHTRSIVGARVGIWEKRGPGDPSLPQVKGIKGEQVRARQKPGKREREKETEKKKKEEKDTGAKWGFEWMNGSDRSGGCKYNSHSK